MGIISFERRSSYIPFTLALILAVLATFLLNMLASVYLKDIAATFGVTPGVASRVRTITEIVAIPVALILGFMTLRFNHKYLIMTGLVTILLGLVGVYFAPNFTVLQIFYPLDGVGSPIVGIVALVMIGDLLPLEKKGKTMGWVLSFGTLSYLIGLFIGGAIVDAFGSWRSILPVLALPLTIAALILVHLFVPSKAATKQATITRGFYFSKFRRVLTNKSAVGCLAGTFLRIVLPITGSLFGVAFFRTYWNLSLNTAILILMGWVAFSFFGTWIGGQIVDWGGRKRLTVLATFLEAGFVISFVSIPIAWGVTWVWAAVTLSLLAPLFSGIGNTSVTCLYLEQVPEVRGPMMSLRSVFASMGLAFGVALAGYLLDLFGYQMIGLTLGTLGLVSGFIFLLLVKDPIKTQK